jgi:Arc/MetJ-type ribon-helix-helix transcriptional regulator
MSSDDKDVAVLFCDQLMRLLGFDIRRKNRALIEEHVARRRRVPPRLGFAINSPRSAFRGDSVHRRRPRVVHHLAFRAESRAEIDRLLKTTTMWEGGSRVRFSSTWSRAAKWGTSPDEPGCDRKGDVLRLCNTIEMTTSVRLDPKTEKLLEKLARERTQSKSDVIRQAIESLAAEEKRRGREGTLLDSISDLVGSVDGGRDDLSEQTGWRFRELLAKKRTRS